MRTIVSFALSITLWAQPGPTSAELIEKKIADGRETIQDRVALTNLYLNSRSLEKRREQVLWMAEHHPEQPSLRDPQFNLGQSSALRDREGFEMEAAIWRKHIATPDISPLILTNAAWFFRFEDRELASSLVKKAGAWRPGDPGIAKLRGTIDVIELGGFVEIGNGFSSDERARELPAAKQGRVDVEASKDTKLLIAAADLLTQWGSMLDIRYFNVPALGGEDALDVAEKWYLRAREREPDNKDLSAGLSRLYEQQARQAQDPRLKAQLLRKTDALVENSSSLPQLALAEFEAGDDEAAIRDAHRMLDRKTMPLNFVNVAHTVLGRVALAKGDITTAKTELAASIPHGVNGPPPNPTLAQDLLDAGEREVVIEYFQKYKDVWIYDQGMGDNWIRLAKGPGHPDLSAGYKAGLDAMGRQAKLPDEFKDKIVAIQFRNSACKTCAAQSELMKNTTAVKNGDILLYAIDEADKNPLTQFLEIGTYPTVILVSRNGRVNGVIPGRTPDQELRNRLENYPKDLTPRGLAAPVAIKSESATRIAWKPVPTAESYVVQWDQRDGKGWLSDRDEHLVRVIPTHETTVALDPSLGETATSSIRWRVFAVNRSGAGTPSEWNEIAPEIP